MTTTTTTAAPTTTLPAPAPAHVAARAAAMRLLEEADAAGIGLSIRMGSTCMTGSGVPEALVYDHYGDPLPILRRATDCAWREIDHGQYDATGAWQPHMVALLEARVDGVTVHWNGTPEQAARLRAAMAAQAPLETPGVIADMSAQDALDTVASAG